MRLLGSAKKDVGKGKDGQDVPKLESDEVALVYCNLVNNNYQQTSAEFQFVEMWFTDQNNRPLEIDDSINITLIIG